MSAAARYELGSERAASGVQCFVGVSVTIGDDLLFVCGDRCCEAGVRTGGRKLEGSKREMDRNGSAYSALLVEYDDVLAFFPRVCCVF